MRTHLHDVILLGPGTGNDHAPTSITVDDGRISAIGATSTPGREDLVIDLEGRCAIPGLVNAHDHLYSHELRHPLPGWDLARMRAWLDARDPTETFTVMLRAALGELAQGITTIRDLGARHGLNTAVARALQGEGLLGPKIVAAGRPVVMTGGHVASFGREADGPWDCRRAVREQVKAGAAVIKVMASGGLSHYPDEDFGAPQFTQEELRAITDEARRRGVSTCAHAFSEEAVHRAVAAGVDGVEHGVEISDQTLDLMRRRETSYVPTLANMRRIASKHLNLEAGVPERSAVLTAGVVEPHGRTFRRAVQAGVSIGVGTDSTGTYQEELEAMMELGMEFDAVLEAATATGAAICRQPAGRLEVGLRADLAIYDQAPRTPAQLVAPSLVHRSGRLVSTADVRKWAGIRVGHPASSRPGDPHGSPLSSAGPAAPPPATATHLGAN